MNKLFYKTINIHTTFELPKIKWSRFIGDIFHVENKDDVEQFLQQIKDKYPDATHHCYAYKYDVKHALDIFGNTVFSTKENKANDDGEPTGTAGKPILNTIEKNQIFNVLIVVTRYFGGTMLGAGGLVQAYGNCAKKTLENTKTQEAEILTTIQFTYNFDFMPAIRNLLNKYHTKIIEEKYDKDVYMKISLNSWYLTGFKKDIFDISKGTVSVITNAVK